MADDAWKLPLFSHLWLPAAVQFSLLSLCYQLEKLQAENAQEWGKRERLETEKLALERENKKCRHEIEQLEEEIERKSRQTSATMDSDMKALQSELQEKQKVGEAKQIPDKFGLKDLELNRQQKVACTLVLLLIAANGITSPTPMCYDTR